MIARLSLSFFSLVAAWSPLFARHYCIQRCQSHGTTLGLTTWRLDSALNKALIAKLSVSTSFVHVTIDDQS
jgi:hypothetical protein